MKSPAERPDHDQEQRGDEGLPPLTVHDIQASLTIIKAQAQMLRRWVGRQDMSDGEAVSARLAMIDDAVTRLAAKISALRWPGRADRR